jgi:ABC-2 type transport system permease protein
LLGFFLLNSAVFTLVTLSLGFCVGTFVRSENQLAGIAVTLSMVFSFLGGVFVSLDFMSEKLQRTAKFLPSYWYVRANTILSYATRLHTAQLSDLQQSMLVQLAFAAAFFGIALVISKQRSNRTH